jgi:hypothetical protein
MRRRKPYHHGNLREALLEPEWEPEAATDSEVRFLLKCLPTSINKGPNRTSRKCSAIKSKNSTKYLLP